jgi:hypothetical protein
MWKNHKRGVKIMAASKKAYFGLGRLITVILAIFPLTNVPFGIITRLMRGKILGALLNLILAPIFYVVDLITVLIKKDITLLA